MTGMSNLLHNSLAPTLFPVPLYPVKITPRFLFSSTNLSDSQVFELYQINYHNLHHIFCD